MHESITDESDSILISSAINQRPCLLNLLFRLEALNDLLIKTGLSDVANNLPGLTSK